MEYTSALYGGTFRYLMAKTKEETEEEFANMREVQKSLNDVKQAKPWFNGDDFSMTDIFAAPYFIRADFAKKNFGTDLLEGNSNLQDWSERLLAKPSVQNSIVEGFNQIMLDRMKENESYLTQS